MLGSFTTASSYTWVDSSALLGYPSPTGYVGVCYHAPYLYYSPYLSAGLGYDSRVLRYDTTKAISDSTGWAIYDIAAFGRGFYGCVSDNTYIYFTPYFNGTATGRAVRHDPSVTFNSAAAWVTFNLDGLNGLKLVGFRNGVYDGKYVYMAVSFFFFFFSLIQCFYSLCFISISF